LLIGQLEGGTAKCSYQIGEDYYGKISYSWTNNNHPDSNRLDYWLDPLGLGLETLEGLDASNLLAVKNIEKQENTISIYPNPTYGQLIIDNGQLIMKSIEVYDVVGRKIIYVTDIQNNNFVLDIANLRAGLYILKINTGEGSFMKKIVKQ